MAFALVAALSFWRFGRRTADTFFTLFALAFALMAVNSAALGLTDPSAEQRIGLYLVRLASFSIILVAIWQKNRASS